MQQIDTRSIDEVTEQSLIQMMVGKEVKQLYPAREHKIGEEVVLQVNQMSLDSAHRVSFNCKKEKF